MASHSPFQPPSAELIAPANPALSAIPIEGELPPGRRVRLLGAGVALFALWFAYDGWLNGDPAMQRHVTFNRVGTLILGAMTAAIAVLSLRVERTVLSRRSSRAALLFLSPSGDSISVATAPWLWSLVFGGLNLIPHRGWAMGLLWFVATQLTFGTATIFLSGFAARLIGGGYEAKGWRKL